MKPQKSFVLDGHVDPDYVPGETELAEYARYLGMEPEKDKDLLWIAEESLKAPLPKDWKPCQTEDGDIYYFNFKTGTSLWEHPMDEHYRQLYAKEKKKILESQADSGFPLIDDSAMTQHPPDEFLMSPRNLPSFAFTEDMNERDIDHFLKMAPNEEPPKTMNKPPMSFKVRKPTERKLDSKVENKKTLKIRESREDDFLQIPTSPTVASPISLKARPSNIIPDDLKSLLEETFIPVPTLGKEKVVAIPEESIVVPSELPKSTSFIIKKNHRESTQSVVPPLDMMKEAVFNYEPTTTFIPDFNIETHPQTDIELYLKKYPETLKGVGLESFSPHPSPTFTKVELTTPTTTIPPSIPLNLNDLPKKSLEAKEVVETAVLPAEPLASDALKNLQHMRDSISDLDFSSDSEYSELSGRKGCPMTKLSSFLKKDQEHIKLERKYLNLQKDLVKKQSEFSLPNSIEELKHSDVDTNHTDPIIIKSSSSNVFIETKIPDMMILNRSEETTRCAPRAFKMIPEHVSRYDYSQAISRTRHQIRDHDLWFRMFMTKIQALHH